jgi:putative addiction module component (TIGR02574 family)
MSAAELLEQVKALPLSERIELANRLWADLAEEGHDPDLAPEEVAELDRRAEEALAHPERSRPLDDVLADIEKRVRARR